MRLIILLLFTGLVQTYAATAYSQEAHFTIKESNIPLKKLFRDIEQSSDYSFFYRLDQINLKEKVTVSVQGASIEAVLKQALQGQGLAFNVIDKIVVIKPLTSTAPQTVIRVRGMVTDSATHAPLAGVSIQVRGLTGGTATNEKGEFAITASDSAVLLFSSIGYASQHVPVNGRSYLNIIMKADNSGMNEAVVVGYGTQKRSNVTGAVAQVDSKMLEDRPVSNVGQALQGVIPNLNITFSDGHPGNGAQLNIRGYTSINGGTPLVVIDGVPGDINLLNPADVETISVLKDASSAALYGGRAAYGVLLITTKHGRTGKMQVT